MICKKWPGVILILLVLTFTGCSKNETKLVSSWTEPTFTGPPMQRVLVIGVMNTGLNRHVYEDSLVETLHLSGIEAISSHTLIPKIEDLSSKENVMAMVEKSKADHVLVAVLKDKKQYSGEYTSRNLYSHFANSYQNLRPTDIERAGNRNIQLETTIFVTATKEVVWAGTTKSYKPDSVQIILDGNMNLMQTTLKEVGLLP